MSESIISLNRERESTLAEISTVEKEITTLSKEIQQLKRDGSGKTAEVRRIEKMLEAKYADFRRQHPIDRTQETEIDRFISSKTSSLEYKSESYEHRVKSHLDSMRWVSFSSMRDPKMTPYKDRVRDMVKQYIEELKILFDEVDAATEKFYKKGISSANLQKLIRIMSKIWDEGESVTVSINSQTVAKGSLPVRYSQKITRWKTAAKDIPEDLEAKDREKELSAKKAVQDKLNGAEKEISKLEKELSTLQSDLSKTEGDLASLQKKLKNAEEQYESSKTAIEQRAEENKATIQDKIAKLLKEKAALQNKKQELEAALAKTFALAFGKKKELKEQIAATDASLVALDEEEKKNNAELNQNEEEKTTSIAELDSGLRNLRKQIRDIEPEVPATKKKIESQKKAVEVKKAQLPSLKKAVEDFHEDYLIKTFGGMVADPDKLISEKQKRIDQLQTSTAVLHQRIESIDTRILQLKEEQLKEEKKRAEERKAQEEAAAKAQQERPVKQETEEEMRARIEAEIRAKLEAEARERIIAEEKRKAIETAAQKAQAESKKVTAKFTRPYVADRRLAASLDRAFDKLESYFPEGKVFAFDNIDSELRERMAELYKRAGYTTVESMLKAYGFEIISGDAVKELRNFVVYTPGNEPDVIKNKVESVLRRLDEYYPDHVISRSIQNDHKNLSGHISGLYQWLGYADTKAMLEAYGYQYNVQAGGRPTQDYQQIIDALLEKYKDSPKPRSMGELLFDNPDLKGSLKTLQNKSGEVFGMTLKKYFEEIGIFAPRGTGSARAPRTTNAGTQDAVLETLTKLYAGLDESEYGSIEDALDCLEGMNVKQNKSGQVYIFRAVGSEGSVTIPYGIDFISNGSFMGQRNLREVIISAALTEIPAEAFSDCPALSRIDIPEGVISIGSEAFANCTSLREIKLPESLQQIASKAFANCTSLERVELLNPMTLVSEDAFIGSAYNYESPAEAEATDSAYFKYSMDRKGNITISGFTGEMETVVIPGMIEGHPVTTIGKGAFQNCKHLVDVSMSDYITTMQGDSFRDCISLKKIHLSNGISKIITTSFNGCIGLKEINIPDGVTEIKRATFKDSPLEKLHIGKSLSAIESKPFYNGEYDPYTGKQKTTRAINKITVDPANPYLKAVDAMVLSKDGKTLYAMLGNKKSVTIPEGVEVIGNYAFEGLTFLSDVILPESLVAVREKAFSGTAIRSVTLGQNVKRIGTEAYAYCPNLTAAVFNDGLEEIGDKAFAGSPIVSVQLPASVRKLGAESFNCLAGGYYGGNESRQSFKIDSSNPYIKADGNALYTITENKKTLQALYGQTFHQYIYDNRQKTPEYTVQDGTTHIGPAAFGRCTSLSKVTLPEGLISIGDNAFVDCQNLSDVVLPSTIEVIGDYAFRGTSLKNFVLGAAVREIGNCAFITGNEWEDKRTELRGIKVDKNNSTYYIDNKALMMRKADGTSAVVVYFGGDEIVALPDGVSEILRGAFKRSIVQEIQIPASVTAIGEEAFAGCSKLTRLRVGFAEPENGANFAVVYIPETKRSQNDYADSQIRDQYMDCIRVDGSGTIFDFVKYDSLFETITASKDKILVATDRLKSAIQLVPLYREKYFKYLRRNAKKAVEIVVEFDDLSGLNTLAELEIFTGKNIDQMIELANKAKKTEILSYLMNYKNAHIGITEEDYDL